MPGSHLALVICHRWFKTGEGWAWADSWRDDDLKQVRTLIQNDLASLRCPDHGARYRHRRGVLLVRTTDERLLMIVVRFVIADVRRPLLAVCAFEA